jgi:catechol 2,3-dioxygenase-like lactoylglutathione lyase family enzyme
MPKLGRVLETCLHVEDIDRAAAFYENVLGLRLMTGSQRFRAFDVGDASVLLLFLRGGSQEPIELPGGTIPPHGGSGCLHMAFAIAGHELPAWEKWFEEHGVAIESKVHWSEGGSSIYFRDLDGHLLELATPGLWPNY